MPKKQAKECGAVGVIYARFSSDNQREESIEQQVEACQAFAKSKGITIAEVYSDEAISGRTDRRPAFQRMLEDAEDHKFSVVIAYKSSRIARNMFNALMYEQNLNSLGIRTLYAKEEFGDTASGRFALRMMMNVNQFYSENLSEDVKRGMLDNARNCKANGPLPYGYKKGADGRYEIDEPKAEIVREIFRRVLSGEQFASVAADLNRRGLKTRTNGVWNKGSFWYMLSNENYIGVYKHSGVVIPDGVPAIISKEVFSAMQDYLPTIKHGKNDAGTDYLLTGKLKCGHCDNYMVGISGTSRNGTTHHYYQCNGRRAKNGCKKEHVRREWIEEKVVELTKEIVLQDDVIDWIAESVVEIMSGNNVTSEIEGLEQQLTDDKRAQSNLLKAIEAGIFSDTTQARMLELEADISKLEKMISDMKTKFAPLDKDKIVFAMVKLRDGDIHDHEYQRQLIETFVKSVVLWDDRIEIGYNYTGSKNRITLPISSEKSENSASDKCSYSLPYGSPREFIRTGVVIFLLADSFVLASPLSKNR